MEEGVERRDEEGREVKREREREGEKGKKVEEKYPFWEKECGERGGKSSRPSKYLPAYGSNQAVG